MERIDGIEDHWDCPVCGNLITGYCDVCGYDSSEEESGVELNG